MQEQGVEILTCGTCLDFYGLKEKLAVGGITNMYSIVEKLNTAGRILRPSNAGKAISGGGDLSHHHPGYGDGALLRGARRGGAVDPCSRRNLRRMRHVLERPRR